MCKFDFDAPARLGDKAPAMRGCVSVAIDGHCECRQPFGGSHTEFKIRVQNVWSTTTVSHRYSEFVELDNKLRSKMVSLPDLPPKDYWKKLFASFMNDKTFMNEREHALGKLLEAMVSCDPALRNPELREFLGVRCCVGDGR
mmetsp:Transcript_122542/g.192247  ORF Transcript_122542/g.192247 Transcript_122542/m.192247 type:complete len:142 (+) Transcript_122542:76-501(+)